MTDTNEKVNNIFIKMMMKKTNEERLIMGCSMFDAVKTIVVNSIKNKQPDINKNDLRVEIFLRFYGLDFNETEKQKIIRHIEHTTAL